MRNRLYRKFIHPESHFQSAHLMVEVEFGSRNEHRRQGKGGPHAAFEMCRQQLSIVSNVWHMLVQRSNSERPTALIDFDCVRL